jgi:hypothetical protein
MEFTLNRCSVHSREQLMTPDRDPVAESSLQLVP